MRDMKIITLAMILAMSMSACQLEELLGGVTPEEIVAGDDVSAGSDIVEVDGAKFEAASDPVDIDSASALTNARNNLADKMGSAAKHMVGGAETVFTMLEGDSGDPIAKMLKGAGSAMTKISGREEVGDPLGIGSDIDNIIPHLEEAKRDGNTIVWKIKSTSVATFCTHDEWNEATGAEESVSDAACVTLTQNARLVQKLATADSGVFVLKYNDLKPIGFGYSPDEWYVQGNLKAFRDMVVDVETIANVSEEDSMRLPAKMNGVVRMGLKDLGTGKFGAGAGIIEDIVVTDASTGTDINVGKSRLLQVDVDTAVNTVKVTLNVAAVDILVEDTWKESDWNGSDYVLYDKVSTFSLAMSKLTGEIVIDGTTGSESITATNVSLGGVGNALTVKDSWNRLDNANMGNDLTVIELPKDINIKVTPAPGRDAPHIVATTDLEVKINNSHKWNYSETDFGDEAEALHVTAPAGTAVELYEVDRTPEGSFYPEYHSALAVEAGGPVTIVHSENGGADESVVFEVSKCYDMDQDDAPPAEMDCTTGVLVP